MSLVNNNLPHSKPFQKRVVLWLIIFVNFLRSLGSTSVSIGLPEFIINLTGTVTDYGIVLGIFSITQTILQTPGALLSDKYGRKITLIIGMIIYLIGTLLCSFAQSIPQLIFFRALQGAGAYSSILLSVVSDGFEREERNQALSYYMISLTGGYLLGNVIGGIVVEWLGTRGIFYVNTVLIFFALILIIAYLPETNPLKIKSTQTTQTPPKDWSFVTNIEFIFGVFMNSVRNFCLSGIIAYQVWLFTQGFELSELLTSLVLLPLTIIYILGILTAPYISKRLGILRLIQFSAIIFVVTGVIIILNYNLWWYLGFSLIAAFSLGLLEPETAAFTQNYLTETGRGMGNGIYNTFGFLFGAIGQIVLPAISARFDFEGVYLFLIGIWVLMIVLIIGIRKKYD